MKYNKTKSTKRFTFGVNRNSTAKKAGSNIVTIATNGDTEGYSSNTVSLSLTVREARALQTFLDENLSDSPVEI